MSLGPTQLNGSHSTSELEQTTGTTVLNKSGNDSAAQETFSRGMSGILSPSDPGIKKAVMVGQITGTGFIAAGALLCLTGGGSSVGVPLIVAGAVILGISLLASFSMHLLEEMAVQNPKDPQWTRTLLTAMLKTLSVGFSNMIVGSMKSFSRLGFGPGLGGERQVYAQSMPTQPLQAEQGPSISKKKPHKQQPRDVELPQEELKDSQSGLSKGLLKLGVQVFKTLAT